MSTRFRFRLIGPRVARRLTPWGWAFFAALLLAAAHPCLARVYSVSVDGKAVAFGEIGPVEVSGHVLVPLRGVLEKTGATVTWTPGSSTIIAVRGSTRVELPIGGRTATVNGKPVALTVPAMLMRGTTMVPLRFLAQSLGARVDEAAGKIRIATRAAAPKPVAAVRPKNTKPHISSSTPAVPVAVAPSSGGTAPKPPAGGGTTAASGKQPVLGTLTEVLQDQTPPAVGVRVGNVSLTLPLAPGAVVLSRLGATGTAQDSNVKELVPGDQVMAKLDATGKITILVAQYDQVEGDVTALSDTGLEVKGGGAVTVTQETRFAYTDGKEGKRPDLLVGDAVRVRLAPGTHQATLVTLMKASPAPRISASTPGAGEVTPTEPAGNTPETAAGPNEGSVPKPPVVEGATPAAGGTENPTPGAGETPQPGGGTPAAGGETPRPGGETPTPGGETPAPGVQTPAAGGETTQPGVQTPAAGGEAPQPGGEAPTAQPGTAEPRAGGEAPAPELKVTSFTHDAKGPLRAGTVLTVTLEGDPGAEAKFDVGTLATNLAMQETEPGKYAGTYTVPEGLNGRVSVMGRLTREGRISPLVQAGLPVVVDSVAPTSSDLAPGKGSITPEPQPIVYAVFEDADGSGVDPDRLKLMVAGEDVTLQATRTPRFITYRPLHPLANGPVKAELTVIDKAGNQSVAEWEFTVNAPEVAITSVSHSATRPVEKGQNFTVTMAGKPRGKASFDIGTMKVGLPMQEVAPGIYQARYTAEKDDMAVGVRIQAHLTLETGEEFSRECSEPISVLTLAPKPPVITSPAEGDAVESPLVVTGKAQPGLLVRVQVVRTVRRLGLWSDTDVVAAHEGRVEADGSFTTAKLQLPRPRGGGETLTIQALAIDPAAHRSEVVSVKVKLH